MFCACFLPLDNRSTFLHLQESFLMGLKDSSPFRKLPSLALLIHCSNANRLFPQVPLWECSCSHVMAGFSWKQRRQRDFGTFHHARPCLSHQAQKTNTLGGAFCSCCQCLGAVIAPSFGSVLLSAPLVMAGSARLASGDRQALCLSAGSGRKAAARPAKWQGFLCTLLIKPLGRCSPAWLAGGAPLGWCHLLFLIPHLSVFPSSQILRVFCRCCCCLHEELKAVC